MALLISTACVCFRFLLFSLSFSRCAHTTPPRAGFIVIDTQKMLRTLSTDEYIMAAINLYLDIINLFLYILRS